MRKTRYATRIGIYSIAFGVLSIAGYFTHPTAFSQQNPFTLIFSLFIYYLSFIVLGAILVSRISNRDFRLDFLTLTILSLYVFPTLVIILFDPFAFFLVLLTILYPIIIGIKFIKELKKEKQQNEEENDVL